MGSIDALAMGHTALIAADWAGAKAHFEEALQEAERPEAQDGLGIALWWLNEIAASHEHRTTAFVLFKQRGDLARAGRIAAWLAREQVFLYGNRSAMMGWFAWAERLLSQVEACPEQGWLAILRASMLETPAELLQTTLTTLQIARQFDDSGLEIFAMALRGAALVGTGQIADGMACLDEALAIATSGEITDFVAISESFCVTLSACELAGDLVRCEHWCQVALNFAERYKCPFLSAYCRTTFGSLQISSGRWQDAEATLTSAIHLFDAGHRGLRVSAILKLAELRVCQGRLEEAEVLLTGYEDHGGAVVPLARLALARGQYEQARAILDQVLQTTPAASLDQVPLLALSVEASLHQGNLDSARQSVEVLMRIAETAQSDVLYAQADIAEGQMKYYAGDADAASSFQAALVRLRTQEQSLLAGRARFAMAQMLATSDPIGAVVWAKAALATFERMGAKHDADRAAGLLRQLGNSARSAARSQDVLTEREGEVLGLLANGLTNREIAERLVISPKTVEHHVSQILSKLGLRSRAEAAAFASKHPGHIPHPPR